MKHLSIITLFCSLFYSLLFSSTVWAQKLKYPEVSVIVGTVQTESNQKIHTVREKTILKTERKLWIEGTGKARIELGQDQTLLVFSNTRLRLGEIDPTTGLFKNIYLESGQIRIISQTFGTSINIQSPVTDFSVNQADMIFSYNEELKQFETRVFKGNLNFKCLNCEAVAQLENGFRAVFQAETFEGEPSFDHLLHGVKVARGKLTPPIQMSEEEITKWIAEYNVIKQVKPSHKTAKKKVAPKLPGQICGEPNAKFNQCVYKCVNNPKGEKECRTDMATVQCLRQRCNANGEWKEEVRLPAQFKGYCMSAEPLVTDCYGF